MFDDAEPQTVKVFAPQPALLLVVDAWLSAEEVVADAQLEKEKQILLFRCDTAVRIDMLSASMHWKRCNISLTSTIRASCFRSVKQEYEGSKEKRTCLPFHN